MGYATSDLCTLLWLIRDPANHSKKLGMAAISILQMRELAQRPSAGHWGAETRNWTFFFWYQLICLFSRFTLSVLCKSICILHPRQNQFLFSSLLLKSLQSTLHILFLWYWPHYLVIRDGSEFPKAYEIFKAGCLMYLGGHGFWHIDTQCRFVELGKRRVRMEQSQKVPLIKEKGN